VLAAGRRRSRRLKKMPGRAKTLQTAEFRADKQGMTDNFAIRQEIIDRLGSPEPELPGVMFMGTSTPASDELFELFDDMCMQDLRDREVLERAIAKLEQVRARE